MITSVLILGAACSDEPSDTTRWSIVHQDLPEALLSVWGTSAEDVWAVGSDVGDGPLILHYDGASWERVDSGQSGDLWWVHGFAGGPIFMGGAGGQILRYENDVFTAMDTPSDASIVFGIWGATPEDMWAVGGSQGGARGAFAWRLEGETWMPADDVPAELVDSAALWKVHGRSADDVWMVGTNGAALYWDGSVLTRDDIPTGESLFTLHANSERFAAVGGFGTGDIFENDGSGWVSAAPTGVDAMVGVNLTADGGWAVGQNGSVLRRDADGWTVESTDLPFFDTLHAVWVDPEGGVWAVGGQVQVAPLIDGGMIHRGEMAPGGGL